MLLSLLIAFTVTTGCLLLLLSTPLERLALDRPNHRSLHTAVTPRTGGLAIMAGLLCGWAILDHISVLTVMMALLVVISLIDDVRGLSVKWRLTGQILIATFTIFYFMPEAPFWQTCVLVLAVTWMLNLYNFMDGSDGLAGGMAVFGFGAYALAANYVGHVQLAALSGTVSAASLAFLFFNFHPARIFMGDAGSVPLGFLAAALGIWGWQDDTWPLWFPLLVFSAFIFDASLTLAKRAARGERIWQAHRSHYYQRLVQMGWGHRKTAVIEYLLMLATSGSALFLIQNSVLHVVIALVAWLLAYTVLAIATDYAWKNFNRN